MDLKIRKTVDRCHDKIHRLFDLFKSFSRLSTGEFDIFDDRQMSQLLSELRSGNDDGIPVHQPGGSNWKKA